MITSCWTNVWKFGAFRQLSGVVVHADICPSWNLLQTFVPLVLAVPVVLRGCVFGGRGASVVVGWMGCGELSRAEGRDLGSLDKCLRSWRVQTIVWGAGHLSGVKSGPDICPGWNLVQTIVWGEIWSGHLSAVKFGPDICPWCPVGLAGTCLVVAVSAWS